VAPASTTQPTAVSVSQQSEDHGLDADAPAFAHPDALAPASTPDSAICSERASTERCPRTRGQTGERR
jgi:hypothetical protein